MIYFRKIKRDRYLRKHSLQLVVSNTDIQGTAFSHTGEPIWELEDEMKYLDFCLWLKKTAKVYILQKHNF